MMVLAAVSFLAMPVAPLALVVGCSGGGCATVAEGHDVVVVRAETIADLSFEVMDTYLRLEENNRAYLKTISPEFEKTASKVAVDGKAAIQSLRSATKAYKQNRTPENKSNVDTWLAVVEDLRKTALKFTGQAKLSP